MKKKDIVNLLENGGTIKINEFTTLKRMLVDILDNEVDILKVEISINSYREYTGYIKARTFEDIIKEIQYHQSKAFVNCVEKLNKQLKNGYTC